MLVESTFQLGDRLLYLTSPLQRGDDVANLQLLLSRLGFDCGRVDGQFGKLTAAALGEFQQNYGIIVDSICGPTTLTSLHRASQHSGNGPGLSIVRARHTRVPSFNKLSDLRVVIGQFGQLETLTHQLADGLRSQHTNVVTINDQDPLEHIQLANNFSADLYIGIDSRETQVCDISYYHTQGFHSVRAHVLATLVSESISRSGPWFRPTISGMSLQVLRDTKMPAIVWAIGPVARLVPHCAVLAQDFIQAISIWVKTTSMKLDG